jgi:hypothetical protein
VIADPIDDVPGAIGIANDTVDRFPYLAQVGRLLVQKIRGRTVRGQLFKNRGLDEV